MTGNGFASSGPGQRSLDNSLLLSDDPIGLAKDSRSRSTANLLATCQSQIRMWRSDALGRAATPLLSPCQSGCDWSPCRIIHAALPSYGDRWFSLETSDRKPSEDAA